MHKDHDLEAKKLNKKLNDFEKKFHTKSTSPLKKISTQEISFLRTGTEFVSGIIAGVIVGLMVDHFVGIAPWGLIFFFLLGSCAGFFNIYRLCGKIKR